MKIHGRLAVTLLVALSTLGLLIAGCASSSEPGPASAPATAVETEPFLTEEPTPTPTQAVTPSAEPETPIDSATPQSSTALLPFTEEIGFTVLNQYGGVPRAVEVEDAIAYLGVGPRLMAVDVSDPAGPRLLGQSDILPDLIYDLDVADGIVYLAAGRAGLIVVDASQPADMQVIDSGPGYAGATRPAASRVTVAGEVAYLLDLDRMSGATHLLRLDVADPAQAAFLSSHELMINDTFATDGDRLVVVGNGRLQLREAANPDAILGEAPLASGSYASRAIISGDTAIVIESGGPNGVELFNISDPANPGPLGDLVEIEIFFIDRVATNGRLLAIAGTFGEFGHCGSQIQLVDISGQLPGPAGLFEPESCLASMALQGDNLFIAERAGLRIYDLGAPDDPLLIGRFNNPDGFQDAQGLALHQETAYVLSAEGKSFDVITLELDQVDSNPLGDRLALSTSTLLDLFVSGNTLIAPVWMGGLYTLNISDPAAPQILHQPVEGELSSGDLFTMVLDENRLYTPVVDGELIGGIGLIDLRDPARPALADTVETGSPMILSQALSGDILYALSQGETNQVHLYDLSQPQQMIPIGAVTLPAPASKLAVLGDRVYAGCDGWNCQSLYAIDAADPQNPALAREWALPFGVQEMVGDGQGLFYLQAFEEGIWVLDATDPEDLHLAGHFQLAGEFARLKLEGNLLYAAAFDAGLYVVQIDN